MTWEVPRRPESGSIRGDGFGICYLRNLSLQLILNNTKTSSNKMIRRFGEIVLNCEINFFPKERTKKTTCINIQKPQNCKKWEKFELFVAFSLTTTWLVPVVRETQTVVTHKLYGCSSRSLSVSVCEHLHVTQCKVIETIFVLIRRPAFKGKCDKLTSVWHCWRCV